MALRRARQEACAGGGAPAGNRALPTASAPSVGPCAGYGRRGGRGGAPFKAPGRAAPAGRRFGAVRRAGGRALRQALPRRSLLFPMPVRRFSRSLCSSPSAWWASSFAPILWRSLKKSCGLWTSTRPGSAFCYEQFKAQNRVEQQLLLSPLVIEPGRTLAALAQEHSKTLADAGFLLDSFGDNALLLRAAPMGGAARGLRRPFARGCSRCSGRAGETPPCTFFDELLHRVACAAAVKGGRQGAAPGGGGAGARAAAAARRALLPPRAALRQGRAAQLSGKRVFERITDHEQSPGHPCSRPGGQPCGGRPAEGPGRRVKSPPSWPSWAPPPRARPGLAWSWRWHLTGRSSPATPCRFTRACPSALPPPRSRSGAACPII